MAHPILKNSSGTTDRVTTTTTMERDSPYYNMNHKKQGFAYIFWHKKFLALDERNGSEAEVKNLKTVLIELGFEVQVFLDLKLDEMLFHINIVSREMDHTHNNCFFLAVLSHGDVNKVAASDKYYAPHEVLWNQFTPDKCPSLAGKPKIFLVNCCQGDQLDHGVKLKYTPIKTEIDGDIKKGVERMDIRRRTEFDGDIKRQVYTIPILSDFCIIYATARDHFAFRNVANGSHFIRFLSEELEKHAYNEHLLTILTFVNRRLAVEFESNTREANRNKKKQATYFESSLTRLVKFEKKKE